jgi:hypothetical protein
MEMDVRTSGFEAAIAGIQALDPARQKKVVHDALLAGGNIVLEAVTAAAPINVWPQTPHTTALPPEALKSDFRVRISVGEGGSGVAVIGPGKFTIQVARWLEYGHRLVRGGYSKQTKSGGYRGPGTQIDTVDAHPFIRPAYDAVAGVARAAIQSSLMKGLIQKAQQKMAS